MANQEETIFQEALSAIEKGEKDRGRDLLTRLIKMNPAQAQYWLWMSAVVETTKERVFCLKETLKRDPNNSTARRGLILQGELPPDPSLAVPAQLQQRNWEAGFLEGLSQLSKPKTPFGIPIWAFAGAAALLILIVGIAMANANRVEIPGFVAWIQRYTPAPPPTGAPLVLATATSTALVLRTPTAAPAGLQTATPTALYVNTPHPRTESYRSAVAAYQRGDFTTTINALLQVLKEDPKADVYYLLGEAYRLQNKLKDAAQSYDLAILQDPRFAPAYLGRALLRQATAPDQTLAARADLEKAISLDANFKEAYLELAKMKIGLKEPGAALGDLNTAQQLDAGSPLPFYYRALAYLALNQPDKAVPEARQASQIDPAMLPARRLLAEAERANGNLAGMVLPLEIYTQYVKDDPDALAWLGQAYAASGDTGKALHLLDQAVTLDGQSFEARLARGLFYIEMSNAIKAQEDLRQAYLIRPDSYWVSLGLGRAALINKDGSEAWRSLSAALTQAKTDADKAQAYFWRAQALELNKQYVQSIADWNELLRLNPSGISATLRPTAQARLQQALLTATPATATPSPSPTPETTTRPSSSPTSSSMLLPSASPTTRPFLYSSPTPSPTPSG